MSHADHIISRASTPTAVLLHGAFADASHWSAVIAHLHAAAIDVTAPAVPLRGLAADADYVAGVVEQLDVPVLLVGHDYGGAVATVAGDRAANVVGLVYVAGFALDRGQSSIETGGDFARTPLAAALRPATFRAADGRTAIELYLRPDRFGDVIAADLPARTVAVMAATQRPIAAAALDEQAPAAAWRTVPSWYAVAMADRAIPTEAQRAMARRAGAHIVEIEASHAVALSQPTAVAELIGAAAAATRAPRAA
jgi:pimeloyl-ACP methyl ester carboxylesterase